MGKCLPRCVHWSTMDMPHPRIPNLPPTPWKKLEIPNRVILGDLWGRTLTPFAKKGCGGVGKFQGNTQLSCRRGPRLGGGARHPR